MKITLCAVGRLRKGPEKLLFDDYTQRFEKAGRSLSLGPCVIKEVEDKKSRGMTAEADLLRAALPSRSHIVTMDERGELLSSPDFAKKIATVRDQGQANLAFVIGGADGIDPSLRAQAQSSISFGKMVWPHMLVRVMLAEQLYRAATILSGGPYHRV